MMKGDMTYEPKISILYRDKKVLYKNSSVLNMQHFKFILSKQNNLWIVFTNTKLSWLLEEPV